MITVADIEAKMAAKLGGKFKIVADHRELENSGWRNWLMTLFPFWFSEDFSEEHETYWSTLWDTLQQIKRGESVPNKQLICLLLLGRGLGKSSCVEAGRLMRIAILNKGYSLMISETDDQAQEHLGNCRILIEHPDSELVKYYPGMAITDNADALKGMPTADRKEMFILKNGGILRAKGLTAKMRGLRVGVLRPDDLCHEKGTRIFTDGQWMNVEDHSTARERVGDGLEVRVHGLPYAEVVTPEHRYWVRHLPKFARPYWDKAKDEWVEAQDLHNYCYIGHPIDITVVEPQPIQVNPKKHIAARDDLGRVVRTGYEPQFGVPEEFYDPEWWWLIGLWWGDGHLVKTRGEYASLGITIANTTPHIYSKIKSLCERYDKKLTQGYKRRGCYAVQVAHKPIAQWLAKEWKKGNAMKLPPWWVEQMPTEYQKALIRGYLDADGFIDQQQKEVRLTSVYLDGLLSVRRMLARIGIPASIRNGIKGRQTEICGVKCYSRKKYDLRFQEGACLLGYDIPKAKRYEFNRVFIADGYLWSKIRDIHSVQGRVFVPIDTPSHEYLTAFGRSHNCLDDIDDVNDSLAVSLNKLRVITASILPVQARENVTITLAQNLISDHSVVNQVYTGKTDALSERTIIGPTPAFTYLDIKSEIDDTGALRHVIQPSSIPSWAGLSIERAQKFLDNSGIQTFYAEYQNEFDQFRSGRVIPEYDENIQIITWSDFERVFGERRIPSHWQCKAGLDVGYSEGQYPHYSAWDFFATSAMNSAYPKLVFLYRSLSFSGTSIDDQAEQVRREMWQNETVNEWQMSHERTGEMMTLNQRHGFRFSKFRYYKAEDGVAQWRHLSRIDEDKLNPFTGELGCPHLFYIVDDDQRRVARNDKGLKLFREQVSTWEYVPVKITDSGQTVQKPSKVNDDHCDVTKSILALFGSPATALTTAEKIYASLPDDLKEANIKSSEQRMAQVIRMEKEIEKVERRRNTDEWEFSR